MTYQGNETWSNNTTETGNYTEKENDSMMEDYEEYLFSNSSQIKLNVTGGRDDALLQLIAERMQFNVKYIDTPEKTQGVAIGNIEGNLTFTGGIGMIQRREADLFLGDIPLSWERRQAVEFTFFTLADSGAFVTHAPQKLSEALVLIRPFLWEVWPLLILTILLTAPALFFIVIIPFWWKDTFNYYEWKNLKRLKVNETSCSSQAFELPQFHDEYVSEITNRKGSLRKSHLITYKGIPKGIFGIVVWFLVNLYLKQCK